LTGFQNSPTWANRAIAEAVARDIRAGVLSLGDRLLPQRRLAAGLGIDFTTVSRAYSEAQARGLDESHVGRGTFVAGAARVDRQPDPVDDQEQDLSMNMAPEPSDPALIAKMREGLDDVSANPSLRRYQSATGSEQDKVAAFTWLSLRGMVPEPDVAEPDDLDPADRIRRFVRQETTARQ
jgi:DNA-binding transcriptional MocR family regulator